MLLLYKSIELAGEISTWGAGDQHAQHVQRSTKVQHAAVYCSCCANSQMCNGLLQVTSTSYISVFIFGAALRTTESGSQGREQLALFDEISITNRPSEYLYI